MEYIIEIKIDGEWKLWQKYECASSGISPKERAEMGLKTASCYGECRIIEIK